MGYKVYEFNAAIVRRPAFTVTAGLRAFDRGDPTYEGVRAEHDGYVAALRQAGVQVDVLEPVEAFPGFHFRGGSRARIHCRGHSSSTRHCQPGR